MLKALWFLIAIGAMLIAGPGPASAHDARPLSIAISEEADNVYRVRLQVPSSVEPINQPRILWPAGCVSRGGEAPRPGAIAVDTLLSVASGLVTCDRPLDGQAIRFEFALFNPSLSTVARFTGADGVARMAILPPDASEWVVPTAPNRVDVAVDYLTLGVEHILGGMDHLLFVAGLLLIARTRRRILVVITGFTAAHSVTLSLSALEVMNVPVLPTEAVIAFSILFLAHEIARNDANSLAFRYPVLVSSSFGLLHGLGFAAALGEIGLPPGEISTSLLFFNLGVEVGQILFILPVIVLARAALAMNRLQVYARFRTAWPALRMASAYAIGIPASFWLVERIAGL